MTPLAFVILTALVLVVVFLVAALLRRGGNGVVARRGASVGADLGTLRDQPRVRVRSVMRAGPDRFDVTFVPDDDDVDADELPALEISVFLGTNEYGFELLHEWKRAGTPLAIVLPPGSRIVRLRSVEDLQPLTLRRADVD